MPFARFSDFHSYFWYSRYIRLTLVVLVHRLQDTLNFLILFASQKCLPHTPTPPRIASARPYSSTIRRHILHVQPSTHIAISSSTTERCAQGFTCTSLCLRTLSPFGHHIKWRGQYVRHRHPSPDRPVSTSSNILFDGLPSLLRPFGPQFSILFVILLLLLFILVTCRSQFDLYLLSFSRWA